MSKRTLIPLAAVALVCAGTVAVAHAATTRGSTTRATCTARPNVTDVGTSQQITVVCTVPKPPGETVTSTETSDVTATTTVTATATGPASPSGAPTDPGTPTQAPPTTPPPTLTSGPTPTSPTTPPPTSNPGGFPDGSNTGVPPGTTLTAYTGSCTITSTVSIDAKTVNCPGGLNIRAAGVSITNSKVNGRIVVDTDANRTWSLTLSDSEVDASSGDLPALYNGNITVLRSDIHGGHNAMECQEHSSFCSMHDSWVHDQWQAPSGDTHLGGVLFLGEQVPCTGPALNGVSSCGELVHNTIVCDAPVNSSGGGCTGDINLINHYGPLRGMLIANNLLGANAGASYCTYGSAGFEYPADHIVYKNNVFQRGTNGKCGSYGPVTNFDSGAAGNVWSGNVWDDGAPVQAAR